ncbi:MAG: CocE/NonD family hydrolase [bacterium]|nr:CocE/NonD family hydrolase [bacterium]
MKRTVFILLALIIIGIITEETAASIEAGIKEKLEGAGIFGAVVDINVRISIPKEKNPYSDKDQDLWATIIRPKSLNGIKTETILTCTPNNRLVTLPGYIPLVAKGFTYMIVDLRGTGSSGGEWAVFGLTEQYDTKYIIDEWIPSQDWSNGIVGMIGYSYAGINQVLAAGLVDTDANGDPEHLKAIFPLSPTADVYKEAFIHGGNPDISLALYLLSAVDGPALLPPLLTVGEENWNPTWEDMEEALEIWKEHLANTSTYIEMLSSYECRYDSSWFDEKSPMSYWPVKPEGGWEHPEGARVIPKSLPVFMTGGWFDIFTRGTLNQYEYGLKNHSNEDKAMIVGEWYHAGTSMGLGLTSIEQMILPARWFEWKLRGKEDNFMKEYPVILQVMGDGRWRAEKSWPLPESRVEERTLYLSKREAEPIEDDWFSNKSSNQVYSLVESSDDCDYNEENPVMEHSATPLSTHGSLSRSSVRWLLGMQAIPGQFSKLKLGINVDEYLPYEDERYDDWKIPTFTTEPFEEETEIAGPLTLTFWARTEFTSPLAQSGVDFMTNLIKEFWGIESNLFLDLMNEQDVQWVAELNDVFPNGRARNLTSGWLRASHRPYDPDEAADSVEHDIDPSYSPFDPFYNGPDKEPKPITEGELYRYTIELWPTCNRFKKGHRMRVTLTGSDFPHLLPILRPSKNTIVIDETHRAELKFKVTNANDEGITWKWIDDVDTYLARGTDSGGSGTEEPGEDPGPGGVLVPGGGGCGTAAHASAETGTVRGMLSGIMSTLFMMFFPFVMILVRRWVFGSLQTPDGGE